MSKLQKALKLASLGFYVFPLIEKGKLPLIDSWQTKATRDEAKIKAWWTCPVMGTEQPWNIGIFTGRFGDDQALIVIDVDNKGKKRGDEVLFGLEMEGREFPETLTQLTPTGGRHIIYVAEKPMKQGVDVLGDGLDIRSAGGFIVGPGSVVEKGIYKFISK